MIQLWVKEQFLLLLAAYLELSVGLRGSWREEMSFIPYNTLRVCYTWKKASNRSNG